MISAFRAEHISRHVSPAVQLSVRKAVMADIRPILDLINGYAARGLMLARTEFEISENIRDFSVAYHEDRLVGCAALHFYSPTMGEIRSLAVHDDAREHGVGRRIIDALVEEAKAYALDAVFAFTYVDEFFRKMGFQHVDRGELPLKAWKDCLRCAKFQCCDEIAMVRVLRPEHWGIARPHLWGEQDTAESYIQLPTVKTPQF